MKVLIVGGPRPLATALTQALLDRNRLTDSAGRERGIDRVVELDTAPAEKATDRRIRRVAGAFDDPTLLGELIDADYGVIVDLSLVGAAEGASLAGITNLLDIIRETGHRPKLVVATTLVPGAAEPPLAAETAASSIDGRLLRLTAAEGEAAVAALIDAIELPAATLPDGRVLGVAA